MKLHLLQNKIFKEPKKLAIFIVIILGLILVSIKIFSTKVTAQVIPVKAYEVNLNYGTVFPGEELQKDFTVYYAEEYTQGGSVYRIIKKPKPKWPEPSSCGQGFATEEEARTYCLGNPTNLNCCYPDLCQFLTTVKVQQEESEGDIPSGAYVGADDRTDIWTIYFKVPAIVGHVSQDHIGGVVTTDGDYGCDVSIDIPEKIFKIKIKKRPIPFGRAFFVSFYPALNSF